VLVHLWAHTRPLSNFSIGKGPIDSHNRRPRRGCRRLFCGYYHAHLLHGFALPVRSRLPRAPETPGISQTQVSFAGLTRMVHRTTAIRCRPRL